MNTDPDKLHNETNQADHKEAYEEIDFSKTDNSLLACPKCEHWISGADLNVEETIATCGHCKHVFGFEHDHHTASLRPVRLMPEGVEVLKLRSELDIRLKWTDTTSKSGRAFLLLFAGFWNIIVLPFVIGVIVGEQWGILLFLSAHLLVGLGLLWHLATIYLNRTSVSVTKNKVRVKSYPLKHFLWRNKELETDRIRQLYVSKYVQSTTNGNPNYAYALYAIMDDGEKVALIRGMNRQTQVHIEREMEDFLGIKNRKVPEESSS